MNEKITESLKLIVNQLKKLYRIDEKILNELQKDPMEGSDEQMPTMKDVLNGLDSITQRLDELDTELKLIKKNIKG